MRKTKLLFNHNFVDIDLPYSLAARPSCPSLRSGKKEGLGTLAVLPGSGGMYSMKNPRDLSRKEINCSLMLRLIFYLFNPNWPVVALA